MFALLEVRLGYRIELGTMYRARLKSFKKSLNVNRLDTRSYALPAQRSSLHDGALHLKLRSFMDEQQ